MTDHEFQKSADELNQQIEKTKHELGSISHPVEPGWWSTQNAMTMSASILIFGGMICIISAILLRKGQSAESILRTFGTILIVISALFLVVAGYSDRQIAPVMGLLGTIAGYLLGKSAADK